MTEKLNRLFSSKLAPYTCQRAEKVNLNTEALKTFSRGEENPLLDPIFCEAWVKYLARRKKVNYTFGGYLENRDFLWRGTYLPKGGRIHLGVDINVPEGTDVHCPIPFKVEQIFVDQDKNGGWGGRLLVRTEHGLVIFAHINIALGITEKASYPAGHRIGWIADKHLNGGWFPHLHLQGVRTLKQMRNIDGYSKRESLMRLFYPDPLPILGIDLHQKIPLIPKPPGWDESMESKIANLGV